MNAARKIFQARFPRPAALLCAGRLGLILCFLVIASPAAPDPDLFDGRAMPSSSKDARSDSEADEDIEAAAAKEAAAKEAAQAEAAEAGEETEASEAGEEAENAAKEHEGGEESRTSSSSGGAPGRQSDAGGSGARTGAEGGAGSGGSAEGGAQEGASAGDGEQEARRDFDVFGFGGGTGDNTVEVQQSKRFPSRDGSREQVEDSTDSGDSGRKEEQAPEEARRQDQVEEGEGDTGGTIPSGI
ncbi:MAG: hypothetical protein ACLFS4_01180 [Opitutales bacterium]